MSRRIHKTVYERIKEKYIEDNVTGCWIWAAYRDQAGYGRIQIAGECRYAHRVLYEITLGVDLTGVECDHLCRVRCCVNPSHIEPVSVRENVVRGLTSRMNTTKTSRHVGVSWHKDRKKWQATICISGKYKYLGLFINEKDAAKAYQKALHELGEP